MKYKVPFKQIFLNTVSGAINTGLGVILGYCIFYNSLPLTTFINCLRLKMLKALTVNNVILCGRQLLFIFIFKLYQ